MRIIAFTLLLAFAFSAKAQDPLNGRANVMECSHDEVVAYMELPDPERQAMLDYHAWEKAYQSTEVKKSESNPATCLGLLYGDLQAMGDRVKAATSSLMSMSLPSMSDMMSQLGDKLMESICARVESGASEVESSIIDAADSVRDSALGELERRYGQRAMERYLTDALVSPEFQSMGLRYRNGEIDRESFRRGVRNRWQDELEELEHRATDQ